MVWKKNLFKDFFIDTSNSRKNSVIIFNSRNFSVRIGDEGLYFLSGDKFIKGVDIIS